MTTRRKFIKNTAIGAALVYSGSILSDLKHRHLEKKYDIQEIKQEDVMYVLSDDSLENRLTDNFFDSI